MRSIALGIKTPHALPSSPVPANVQKESCLHNCCNNRVLAESGFL